MLWAEFGKDPGRQIQWRTFLKALRNHPGRRVWQTWLNSCGFLKADSRNPQYVSDTFGDTSSPNSVQSDAELEQVFPLQVIAMNILPGWIAGTGIGARSFAGVVNISEVCQIDQKRSLVETDTRNTGSR